jgi:hypothetical protein
MEEDIRRSRDVGFSHHLVKPVDLNKLDSIIQDVPVSGGTDFDRLRRLKIRQIGPVIDLLYRVRLDPFRDPVGSDAGCGADSSLKRPSDSNEIRNRFSDFALLRGEG